MRACVCVRASAGVRRGRAGERAYARACVRVCTIHFVLY